MWRVRCAFHGMQFHQHNARGSVCVPVVLCSVAWCGEVVHFEDMWCVGDLLLREDGEFNFCDDACMHSTSPYSHTAHHLHTTRRTQVVKSAVDRARQVWERPPVEQTLEALRRAHGLSISEIESIFESYDSTGEGNLSVQGMVWCSMVSCGSAVSCASPRERGTTDSLARY